MGKQVLILHGWTNRRPEGSWQRQAAVALRQTGHQVHYPQLPNPDEPRFADWAEVTLNELAQIAEANRGEEVVVIGHSLGAVTIGDDVEIGVNTAIDRGALADTVIGNGVKLDNQIQIAHNVQIGDHTAMAACVGISGSTKIGKHCMLAGGVGLVGHGAVAGDVVLGGCSHRGFRLERKSLGRKQWFAANRWQFGESVSLSPAARLYLPHARSRRIAAPQTGFPGARGVSRCECRTDTHSALG